MGLWWRAGDRVHDVLASNYDVVVGVGVNRDAAWYYPNPSPAAARIKGRVALWHAVKVEQIAG